MKQLVRMSLVATTGMTLASYIISVLRKKKVLAPVLLNQMIHPEKQDEKAHNFKGYLLHWLVGLGFSSIHKAIWKKTALNPDAGSGLTLGFVNGIAGIAGWHLMLKLHPNPPAIKLKPFYLQLLAVHVLFGYLNQMALKNSMQEEMKAELQVEDI